MDLSNRKDYYTRGHKLLADLGFSQLQQSSVERRNILKLSCIESTPDEEIKMA